MKLLSLSIQGGGLPGTTPIPSIALTFPSQINHLLNLSLQTYITFATTILLTIAILLAFIFLLVGGIRWIMSNGDKKQLEAAQKTIQYAIIGLVVVLLSFFIINFIGIIFGVNLLQVQLP